MKSEDLIKKRENKRKQKAKSQSAIKAEKKWKFKESKRKHRTFEFTTKYTNPTKGENEVLKYLSDNKINFFREVIFKLLPYRRFDFYLPDHNICIEYDGKQHRQFTPIFDNEIEDFMKRVHADRQKNNFCYKNDIKLVRIKDTKINYIDKILKKEVTFVGEKH